MPTPKKRVHRDGSTSWFVRFRLDGTQTTETFDTEAEAGQFAKDITARGVEWALDQLVPIDEDQMTLSEWADRHFAALDVSEATMHNYTRDWGRRWEPHLGDLYLSEITREDVRRALKEQAGADKTIANAWGVLTGIFGSAVLDRHIPISPTVGVRLRTKNSHESTEHRYLTLEEFNVLLTAVPERYQAITFTLAGSGARWSEAAALQVRDFDPDAGAIRIRRAWKRAGSSGRVIGPPKTPKSRRTVTLAENNVELLSDLCAGRGKEDWIFVGSNGEAIPDTTFRKMAWLPARNSVGAPAPRVHDLRHSHVAWLIAAGVSLPVIQARLGHEKITTTIDTYGHLVPDVQQQATEAAQRVFGGVSLPKELG